MIWRFSDGTTVELGGAVEGPSSIAQRLRADLPTPRPVSIWPPPGGQVELDVDDPALLDAYLRAQLDLWTRLDGLKLTLARPDGIPDLPPPPWAGTPGDETVTY